MNPADIASRGASADSTKRLQAWLDGPKFFKDSVYTLKMIFSPPYDFQELHKQKVCSYVKLETTA